MNGFDVLFTDLDHYHNFINQYDSISSSFWADKFLFSIKLFDSFSKLFLQNLVLADFSCIIYVRCECGRWCLNFVRVLNLREFVENSCHPVPRRVRKEGPVLRILTPDPVDPLDPLDPADLGMNS